MRTAVHSAIIAAAIRTMITNERACCGYRSAFMKTQTNTHTATLVLPAGQLLQLELPKPG